MSEETIRALAGHVSKQMLQRCSHIRLCAKQAVIAALEGQASEPKVAEIAGDGAQIAHERLN